LEGNITEVKNRFKKHRFIIEVENNSQNAEFNLPHYFNLISKNEKQHSTVFEIQMLQETPSNEILTYFMKQGTIVSFQELLPSMNDIFIEQVTLNV